MHIFWVIKAPTGQYLARTNTRRKIDSIQFFLYARFPNKFKPTCSERVLAPAEKKAWEQYEKDGFTCTRVDMREIGVNVTDVLREEDGPGSGEDADGVGLETE